MHVMMQHPDYASETGSDRENKMTLTTIASLTQAQEEAGGERGGGSALFSLYLHWFELKIHHRWVTFCKVKLQEIFC